MGSLEYQESSISTLSGARSSKEELLALCYEVKNYFLVDELTGNL